MTDTFRKLEELLAGSSFEFKSGWQRQIEPETCHKHCHSGFEIVYHPFGRGYSWTEDDGIVDFSPGSCFIYPPRQMHSQTMVETGSDVCISIWTDRQDEVAWASVFYLPEIREKRLVEDLQFLTVGHPYCNALHQKEFDCRGTALLLGLLTEWQYHRLQDATQGKGHFYAEKGRRFIIENYRQIAAIDDVARHVGISGEYLRHVFKDVYGVNINDFIRQIRLTRAAELLVNSSLPLKSVAGNCGFANDRYFSKVFRESYGVTPGSFRGSRVAVQRPTR